MQGDIFLHVMPGYIINDKRQQKCTCLLQIITDKIEKWFLHISYSPTLLARSLHSTKSLGLGWKGAYDTTSSFNSSNPCSGRCCHRSITLQHHRPFTHVLVLCVHTSTSAENQTSKVSALIRIWTLPMITLYF